MKSISFVLSVFFTISAYCQLFTFRNFNHKAGLSLSSVTSIAQDRRGNILIGTDGAGIQKFDGYTITDLEPNTLESEHHVSSIDPVGDSIFFSSRYKGFFVFHKGTCTKLDVPKKKIGEYIGIKKTRSGYVLVGSNKIVLIKNGKVADEQFFKDGVLNLVQFQTIAGHVLIICEKESYIVSGSKIHSLNKWLQIDPSITIDFVTTGTTDLHCFSRKENLKFSVHFSPNMAVSTVKKEVFLHPKIAKVRLAYSKNQHLVLMDSMNHIFYALHDKIKLLPRNYGVDNISLNALFIDKNDDFWASSGTSGFFKISKEPFSKVDLHPVYQNPLISFIYKNDFNEVFISDFNDKTYTSSFQSNSFKEFNFRIYGQAIFQNQQLFATSEGILSYKNGSFFPFKQIKGKINFIYAHESRLFYGLEGKGMFLYEHQKTSSCQQYMNVSHVYTAQTNRFQTKIYFGTNDGIFEYNIAHGKFKNIVGRFGLRGSYSGISTTDCYGTLWFSLDKKLVGITKNEDYLVLDKPDYFNSTLFYTLNSDAFGNLWVGTNKGITRLKLDPYGHVILSSFYQKNNGFDGYETHMRSSFQRDNLIFIGTIEGLFLIDPLCFEKMKTPPQPYIFQTNIKNSKHTVYDEDLIKINFISINPKLLGIKYTYRLRGKNNAWSNLSTQTSAYFANLTDQDYVFEVRSSYDGISFSKTSSYELVVKNPFWKSSWFILCLIIAITLGNFVIIDRSRSLVGFKKQVEQENFIVSNQMKTKILIFGFVSTTFTNLFANTLDRSIPKAGLMDISLAIILFLLILLSLSKKRFLSLKNHSLLIAFYSVLFHSYAGAYITAINPYYVVVVCLCTAMAPIILNSFRQIVLFSIFQILIGSSFVLLVDNGVYDEVLFLIAIIVSVTITIFNSYIKNESFEKLLFISSLINKSEMMVVCFDEEQNITYINETFSKIFKAKNLVDANLSQFNNYTYKSLQKNQRNIPEEIRLKDELLLPMKTKDGSFIWVDWKVIKVSNKTYALYGKDITETMQLREEHQTLSGVSGQLVYFVDIQAKIIDYNEAFKDLFYGDKQILNADSLRLVHEDDLEAVKLFYENQFKNKIKQAELTFRVKDKDDQTRILHQTASLVYFKGSDKLVKGFYCVSNDLTEVSNLKEKVLQYAEMSRKNDEEIWAVQRLFYPPKEKLAALFKEHALLFRPKSRAANNFFWAEKINDYSFFALCENSSSGISSSFLTFIASNFLHDIILEEKLIDPSQILNTFEEKLLKLTASGPDLKDITFELSILVHHQLTKQTKYSSSGGKFISVTGGEAIVHRGESKKIGEPARSSFTKYNTYDLLYHKLDYLVFFTDGIVDQYNEQLGKSFSLKRLLEHFKSNPMLHLNAQISSLEKLFDEWCKNDPQEKDITVIAIKL